MPKRKDLKRLVKDFVMPTKTIIKVDYTIEEAIECLRHRHIDERIIYIYVLDDENRLCGVVPTRTLLFKDPSTKIVDVMHTSIICLYSNQTLQEAMEFLESHKLLALPVVDAEKHFLGVIDVDLYLEESLDIVNSRRLSDIFQMIGIYLEEEKGASLWKSYRARMPWIFCNMFGGIACAIISRVYQLVLGKVLLLAFFIPLVLTLSESISMQSVTQSLELTRQKHKMRYLLGKVIRETNIVAFLAATSGVMVGALSLFWGEGLMPALVIGFGIMISVYISSLFGASIPVLLHMKKWDPKVASGPFVLMCADVITTIIYLSLATWWLL